MMDRSTTISDSFHIGKDSALFLFAGCANAEHQMDDDGMMKKDAMMHDKKMMQDDGIMKKDTMMHK